MAFAMSAMAAALPARVAGSRRAQQAPRVALPGFVEGGLRRTAGLGASTASEGVAALGGVSNGCKWTMMRHGKKIHRLGRPADQRKALLRALTTQLLTHGAIETTKTKAKAVRPWIDKMVNLAKDGSDAKKNQAYAWIYDKKIVNALFDEAPARYANRRNDYTFMKLQERKRRGDGVELVLLSLV